MVSFIEQSSLKLRCDTVIERLELYYLHEINNAIHIYEFTLLVPDVVVVSDLNKNIGGSTDLAKKKARIGRFVYPFSPLLSLLEEDVFTVAQSQGTQTLHQ